MKKFKLPKWATIVFLFLACLFLFISTGLMVVHDRQNSICYQNIKMREECAITCHDVVVDPDSEFYDRIVTVCISPRFGFTEIVEGSK